MSEKQSTDELVRALEIQLKMETDCVITNLEIRAIIARLRAGEVGVKFIEHIQAHLQPGQEVICKICRKSVEAIADMMARRKR
jgi:rubrerythrin